MKTGTAGWALVSANGKTSWGAYQLKTPIGFEGGTLLRFKFHQSFDDQHQVGRFRLSLTRYAESIGLGLPEDILVQLYKPKTELGAELQKQLKQIYERDDPKLAQLKLALAAAKKPLAIAPEIIALRAKLNRARQPVPPDAVLTQLQSDLKQSPGTTCSTKIDRRPGFDLGFDQQSFIFIQPLKHSKVRPQMFRIIGRPGKDLCDTELGVTRRDVLRVGGSGMLGMTLGTMLNLRASAAAMPRVDGRGWNKAKSIILIYLQGGPSHLDLWDPKENVPENVRSVFKPISTRIPGIQFAETLPKLAQLNDRFTLIRSMSYTPVGLFNHTAAIYQMMTGYTTDKVSPSGQLEPPTPKDFPNFGSHIIRFKPVDVPMLPFVMLPRPLQESNVVGKGGTAGFLGKAFDPYTLYPGGDDMNMNKMSNIKIDDLKLPPDVFSVRLKRRAKFA